MKPKKASKLFYNYYAYKINIAMDLCFMFSSYHSSGRGRDGARELIDTFRERLKTKKSFEHRRWSTLHKVTKESVKQAEFILSYLDNYECKTRTEYGHRMSIFTNDAVVVAAFKKDPYGLTKEIYEVDPEIRGFLELNPKTCIVNEPTEFEFKVYLKGHLDPSFANWIDGNPTQCKVGDITLGNIREHAWMAGNYIFIKNRKILDLVNLIISQNIIKIENLIYLGDIDKYLHDNTERNIIDNTDSPNR